VKFYPEKIREHFLRPYNVGRAVPADGQGTAGSIVCGAVVQLTLTIDSDSQLITAAKFKAAGCGYLIAAASALTELIHGLRLGEAVGLPGETIERALEVAPADKGHCYKLCRDALEAAAVDYRSRRLEEWTGDDALICTCFGVSESTIEAAIAGQAVETVEDVGRACNAGRGCGSCQPLIQELLDTSALEREFRSNS
jgi:NifU-like protein